MLEVAWAAFGPLPYCKSWGLGLASPGAAGFTCHYAHCPGTLTNLHNVGLKKRRLRFTDLCIELCKTANKRENLSILGKGNTSLHLTWKHEKKSWGRGASGQKPHCNLQNNFISSAAPFYPSRGLGKVREEMELKSGGGEEERWLGLGGVAGEG